MGFCSGHDCSCHYNWSSNKAYSILYGLVNRKVYKDIRMFIRMLSKSNITLSIDTGVLESIKAKNLNISGLCESALREISNTFEMTSDPKTCKHKFTWPFAVPSGLKKECLKCGIFVNVESPVKKEEWINK